MNKKNGFVFVETMITVVILATALLTLYSLFNNIMIREKRKAYYDDPLYVYRANYLSLVFENIIKKASTHTDYRDEFIKLDDLLVTYVGDNKVSLNLKGFSCDNDIFYGDNNTKATCQAFFRENQIYKIYITRYDLSYIDTCSKTKSTSTECLDYRSLSNQAKGYFKQLPYIPNTEGFYLVFEFYDNGDGGVCSNDNCMHQFASVKYGGTNAVVNYNE